MNHMWHSERLMGWSTSLMGTFNMSQSRAPEPWIAAAALKMQDLSL